MSISHQFGFIGWCNDPADNHDKVWGYFYRPTPDAEPWQNCCVFWARRGGAMKFKGDRTGAKLNQLVVSKLNKGYKKIDVEKLIKIWPTFINDVEGKLMWEVLAGKVK
jgi:hypothetical protein